VNAAVNVGAATITITIASATQQRLHQELSQGLSGNVHVVPTFVVRLVCSSHLRLAPLARRLDDVCIIVRTRVVWPFVVGPVVAAATVASCLPGIRPVSAQQRAVSRV
jgi:hypothetical protein